MSRLIHNAAAAGLWFVASSGFGQTPDPQPNPNNQNQNQNQNQNNNAQAGTSLQGKVIRVDGQDRIVVQTADNKEVILMSTPTTQYIINGRAGQFGDVRNGVNVRATYNMQDNRYMVSSFQVGDAPDAANVNQGGVNDRRFRGRIAKIDAANNQIVAKSQDGKEVTLFVQQNGRFLRNGQAVKIAELQVGTVIEAQYVERDNHWWVEEVTVVTESTGANQPATDGTQVEGTVVRIVGQNQVIVRTKDNKELTIDLAPQTTYMFDNQPGQFRDIQPGQDVRVQYNTVERRTIASRIFGNRRAK